MFVSSKVSKDKKNPLIIALHGLGGDQNTMLRGAALDLAEEGGYILVGPMGYNQRGWYGVPRGTGPRPGAAAPPNASGAPNSAPPPRPVTCGGGEDPPNLRELSEQDVLNVLGLVQKEFTVDARRTYLMGHSMGGAGTFHLGVKHPEKWAALAATRPRTPA